MAKKAYVGVNSVARRVKKIYIGINGIARKVRKGYIGVAGIARLFFAFGTLKYYSEHMECATANLRKASASNRNFAFVTDGELVNSFNIQLVCSAATSLATKLSDCCGANAAREYAVFGGNIVSSGYITESPVYAYNASATRTSATSLTTNTVKHITGCNDTYALFGNTAGAGANTTIDLYDGSLTQTTVTASEHRERYCISDNGAYAVIFSGAYYYSGSNPMYHEVSFVDAVNTSGTVTALPSLPLGDGVMYALGARADEYAICAGGCMEGTVDGEKRTIQYRKVHAFNASLTRSIADPLTYFTSISNADSGATADEAYGIIPTLDSELVGHYEAYGPSLVKQVYNRSGSSGAQYVPTATSFRHYALFFKGSGTTPSVRQDRYVDVFDVD